MVGARTSPTGYWNAAPNTVRHIVRATVVTLTVVCIATAVGGVARACWWRDSLPSASGTWLVGGALACASLGFLLRASWMGHVRPRQVAHFSGFERLWFAAPSLFVGLATVWFLLLADNGLSRLLVLVGALVEEWWAVAGMWNWFRRPAPQAPLAEPPPRAAVPASSAASVDVGPAQGIVPIAATTHVDAAAGNETDEEAEEAEWSPPGVTQQLTRGVDPVHGEYVLGILRADFLPGQRNETLHVAFCPPLQAIPRIEVQPLDGPPFSATVAQAEMFGARFELRLNRAWEEAQHVILQFETRPHGPA